MAYKVVVAVGQVRWHPEHEDVLVRVESGPEIKVNRKGEQVRAWRVRVIHPVVQRHTSSVRADLLAGWVLRESTDDASVVPS